MPPPISPSDSPIRPASQPMLWAAIAYSAGIVTGSHAPRPASWWTGAAIAFFLAGRFFCHRRRRLGSGMALGVFFLAGALHIQLCGWSSVSPRSLRSLAYGPQIEITAHVIREGQWKENPGGELREVLDVEAEDVENEDVENEDLENEDAGREDIPTAAIESKPIAEGRRSRSPVRSRIRLSLYPPRSNVPGSLEHAVAPPLRIFRYGERLRLPVKLKLPHNFLNPGAFDYEGYLAANGISALGSAKAEDVSTLPGFMGSRIELLRTRMHSSILAKVRELWPPPQAALIDAMVIGEEAFIDRDTRADFQRSGTYHVLVVSGMNVTILALVAFWTLRRLRMGEIPATLFTILSCVAYAFLTAVGAPVWRATLMCAIFLGTRLLYRERAMVNALGGAAVGLLIYDPRQLFTASFQMTFLCVLIVAAVGVPLVERTSGLYRRSLAHWNADDYGAALPPHAAQFRADLRLIAARLALFIGRPWSLRLVRGTTVVSLHVYELLLVSAAMQMGLALPMAFYFHRATTLGLPANIAVVPLMQLLMPSAILSVALGYISLPLAKISALLTAFFLQSITGTVRGLGSLRLADLRVATPSVSMITAASAALVMATLLARCRAWLAALGIGALLAAYLALTLLPPKPQIRPGVLEVTSIDVGEGDAILVITPQGRALLVDAGGPTWGASSQLDFGEDVVAPYLWTRRITRLDAVAISHGHSDHIGGMPAILQDFRPEELWVGLLPPSRALDRLIAQAHSLGIKVVRHWEGDQLNLGGAEVEVLFPPRDWPLGLEPKNNDSMVMQVRYGATSALLEGDAEKAVERRIALLHHPRAQLLKVGHHGSATSTTPELLASVKPAYAVISDGFHNSYGFPKPDVLSRLQASGARTYRTDVNGLVTFYLDGHSVTPYLPALDFPGFNF